MSLYNTCILLYLASHISILNISKREREKEKERGRKKERERERKRAESERETIKYTNIATNRCIYSITINCHKTGGVEGGEESKARAEKEGIIRAKKEINEMKLDDLETGNHYKIERRRMVRENVA